MTGVEAIPHPPGGETAIEHQGEVHRVKAVVQPIHDRSKLVFGGGLLRLGAAGKRPCHSTMGQPPLPPSRGLYPLWEGTLAFVKQAENFYGKGKALYRWAVLQRAREEEQDD